MYLVYGLRIEASKPIAGLLHSTDATPADIRVEFGYLPEGIVDSNANQEIICQSSALRYLLVHRSRDYFYIRFSDETEFVVSGDGAQVWCTWPASLTLEDTCVYLLGPILGLVQQLMGRTVLHASAVVIEGCAVALMGGPGAGKSTTAAMLSSLGYPVVSDDALPLMLVNGSIMAQPGYALLRLWPESATILYGSESALPRITPTWDKLYLDLLQGEHRFEPVAKPLGAIYILDGRSTADEAPFVAPLPPREAFVALVANPYPGSLYLEARRPVDFAFLGEVLKRVPVMKVVPHADPGRLPQMCELIVEDVAHISATNVEGSRV